MKRILLFFFILFSSLSYSQKNLSEFDIYFENGLAFNGKTHQLLNESVDFKFKVGKGVFKEFSNGKLISNKYYFFKEGVPIIYEELYYDSSSKLVQRIKNYDEKNKYAVYAYDENGKIKTYDYYLNSVHYEHKEYLNGKKHGTWFCIEKDGNICERVFENGKKIKKCSS